MRPHQLAFVFACSLAVTSGCSTFNRDWKKAAAVPAPPTHIAGRWEGEWRSEVNSHHGKLRCLITKLDERRYRARYKATWWKVFRFGYTVDMQVVKSVDVFNFQGEADLGWWAGGVYRYDGRASLTNFFSTYKSKRDHGTFQLNRPE